MSIQADDYALVVGIQHYVSADLNTLSSALNDALKVKAWLLDQTRGGALPDGNVKPLLSKPDSGDPEPNDIDDAIEAVFDQVKQRLTPARRFYFYFSGHGMAATKLQAYLCLPKWSSQRRRMAIDSMDYWQMIANTGLFQEIVCLFDCCRSYKPNVGGIPSTLGSPRPQASAASTNLFIGFAAPFLESAFEPSVTDENGFFTRALLSGLEGGACQSTGGAPAQRLKGFLESETEKLARQAGKKQKPEIYNGFSAVSEPVFGSAMPPGGTGTNKLVYVVSISDAPGRSVVLLHPDAMETLWDGSQPWRIEVAGGLHVLEDRTNGKLLKLSRDVTQGEIHVTF